MGIFLRIVLMNLQNKHEKGNKKSFPHLLKQSILASYTFQRTLIEDHQVEGQKYLRLIKLEMPSQVFTATRK